jgi:hypothetical protein
MAAVSQEGWDIQVFRVKSTRLEIHSWRTGLRHGSGFPQI